LLGSVYQTEQGIYCVDVRDQFVARALIENGHSGREEVALLSLFLTDRSRVLVLGGHIGTLAIPLSKRVAALTVLEANPDTYRLLTINPAINLCANVTHDNLAANDEHGRLEFVMNTVNSGGSKRMPKEKDPDFFYDQPEVRAVPAVRLDDLLFGQTFDMIFMDIEGSEYFAMKGMPELMSRATILVSEFLPHHLSKVAGITVDQFLEPLEQFQTMVAPSLRQTIHGYANMRAVLNELCARGDGDAGLVFHRERITVNFQ
jgi:FkbM family methyltransferase